MHDLALEIAAWALTIAGLAVIAWALFWDRSRGRRRCPKCWYDMDGAKADGDGRLTCSECGRVVRRERRLFKTRRRWWRALAGVCVLGLAYAAVAYPRVRDRGWVGAVPTTGLVLAHPLLADLAPRDAYTYPAPVDANAVWLLGEELATRVRDEDIHKWHAQWIIRQVIATGGPHLYHDYSRTNTHHGVERMIDEGPVRFQDLTPLSHGRLLHRWLWEMLCDNGYATMSQIDAVLDLTRVDAEMPPAWWTDRPFPLRLLIGLPTVDYAPVRVSVRDLLGETLWQASFSWHFGHGLGAPRLGPSANGWAQGVIMLPPGEPLHELDVVIELIDEQVATHTVTRRLAIAPQLLLDPTLRLQPVTDDAVREELAAVLDPVVTIDPDGSWATVFFGYEGKRAPIPQLVRYDRPAIGLRIELIHGSKIIATGTMLLPSGQGEFGTRIDLLRAMPLTLLEAAPPQLGENDVFLLRATGCLDVALRDPSAHRAWQGVLEWKLRLPPAAVRPETRRPALILMSDSAISDAENDNSSP